ncbi:hypothetical protein [Streptomyces sp. NPDC058964]|uniref:hypothetical protein n=1 Tax=Streptomyces sp. NPDC058964 TaxID=3346681 RepID=UPI0036A6F466
MDEDRAAGFRQLGAPGAQPAEAGRSPGTYGVLAQPGDSGRVRGRGGRVAGRGGRPRTVRGALGRPVEERPQPGGGRGGLSGGVVFACANDKLIINLDRTQTEITVDSKGSVTITGSRSVSVEAGTSLTLRGRRSVMIDSGGPLTLKGKALVSLTSLGGAVNVNAMGGAMNLSSSGMTSINATGMVSVNAVANVNIKGIKVDLLGAVFVNTVKYPLPA